MTMNLSLVITTAMRTKKAWIISGKPSSSALLVEKTEQETCLRKLMKNERGFVLLKGIRYERIV